MSKIEYSYETLMKYIGALHSYIHHMFLFFNPTSLDEACVKSTHLENRGKYVQEDPMKKPSNFPQKTFKKLKIKGKKITTVKREGGKPSCTHCRKGGHDEEHCWKLHLENKPKQFDGNRKTKNLATVQQDLGSESGDEGKITWLEYKVKNLFMLVQLPVMNLILMNERGMIHFIYELYLSILR
jgi:hypothetical protein